MEEQMIRTRKGELRKRFRAARTALTDDEYARKSAAIAQRIEALPELKAAQTVHCYWPHAGRREVDTRELTDRLCATGRTVVLPVVTAFAGAPTMAHRCYEGRAALKKNRWGLYEPTGTDAVPPEGIDLVVVPAFGAGRNGHRIGHGFGYYDAFLQSLDAVTVCPVYQACLVETVPAEAHDVPLSILVTEEETFRPST